MMGGPPCKESRGRGFEPLEEKRFMRKLILAGILFFSLSACGSGGNGDERSYTPAIGGGDPSQGGGAGGNTNNIGTDTMRTITADTSGRDTSRRDTLR